MSSKVDVKADKANKRRVMTTTLPDDECGPSMPLHEKRAWLALVSSVVVYGAYFTLVARLRADEQDVVYMLMLFAIATVGHALITAVGTTMLTFRNRAESKEPPDERDRAIARGAATVAYSVLIVEMVVVGIVMPFNSAGWGITSAALLAMVVSEVVRHAVTILNYRRGWHG